MHISIIPFVNDDSINQCLNNNQSKLTISQMSECINDYKLTEVVGQGAFGKVFKAVGIDRKEYALKKIPINPKIKDKIRQQGRLLASMQHPNILWARQFFYYQQERYFVIITEYCNRGGLDGYIGSLDEERTYNIMRGITQGLYYLHRVKEIIHRDLKPENILLDNQWVPKIADMGVAKMLKTYQVSTTIGTPIYMAHEMFEGDYSIQADIWALGIIFLELVVGKRIFELLKGQQIPSKRSNFPNNQIMNLVKNGKTRNLISKMLQKDPKDRINVQQILTFFDPNEVDVLRVSQKRNTLNESKKKSSQCINDCYSKTEEFVYNKYPLAFIKQLYQKNMVEIVSEAELGNKKAIYLLAKMYQYGCGMIRSPEKSEELLLQCYEKEERNCCFQLYTLSTSSSQKFKYLMVGKELAEVRCLCKLAQNYLQGSEGFTVDYQQAQGLIDCLCQIKFPPAFYLKGNLFSKKDTEYCNVDRMKEQYRKGSELGDIQCKLALGTHQYKQKNYQQCLKQCKLISLQNLQIKRKLNIYELIAKCFSKLKNTDKMIEYYKKCIELDNGVIQKDYLGAIGNYFECIKDYQNATKYYQQAINQIKPRYKDNQYLTQRIKFLCQVLYPLYYQSKMYPNAYEIAKLSAQLNLESGKADQAYMIYIGLGVQKDQNLGLSLLKEYAKEKNSDALSYLNDINSRKQKQKK